MSSNTKYDYAAIFFLNRSAKDEDYDLVRIFIEPAGTYTVEYTENKKPGKMPMQITLESKADLRTYIQSTLTLLTLDHVPFYSVDILLKATPSIKVTVDQLKDVLPHMLALLEIVA